MVIKRIEIKSFGQLSDMALEFSDKINIIEGQNEAGKSTIAAFIKYMLYGFGASEGSDSIGERGKRINWDSGIAEGSMDIAVADKKYRITRSTVKTENGGRVSYKEDSSIIDIETGAPLFGKLPAGEVFFGADKELFENTAFIGQVGDASISESSVKQAIENILFSGSERINTQRATNKITEKMETLLHPGNTGGVIMDLIKKQDEYNEKLRTTDEDNKRILAKEAELHEIRMRKKEAEEKRANLLELQDCYCNVKVIQSFDELHTLEEELDRKNAAYSEFIKSNTKNGFVPDNDYITDIAIARHKVDDTCRHMEEAQENYSKERSAVGITKEIEGAIELSNTLGGEDKVREQLTSYTFAQIKCLFGGIAALIFAAASLIVTVAISTLPLGVKILLWILGGLSLAGAGVLAYFYARSIKNAKKLCLKFGTEKAEELKEKLTVIASARNKRDTIINNTENARVAYESSKRDYDAARSELSSVASRWIAETNAQNPAGLAALEERVRAFLAEKNKLLEEKTGIEITVKEIRRSLSDKSEIETRALVSPLRRKIVSEIDRNEITASIEDATRILEEQQRLSFSVENELSELKLRAKDPGELYSKIQELDTKIEELGKMHKAYFVALRTLNSASDNLRAEIAPRLGEYSTELLSIMTDSKYSYLGVDDGLKIKFSSQDGKERTVDYLSGGTRDLTYIAMRMALIDMLYSEAPPICFDETFANQDNVRASAMMKAIKKLSDDGYQSFIFTCRHREAGLASEVQSKAAIFKLSLSEA